MPYSCFSMFIYWIVSFATRRNVLTTNENAIYVVDSAEKHLVKYNNETFFFVKNIM